MGDHARLWLSEYPHRHGVPQQPTCHDRSQSRLLRNIIKRDLTTSGDQIRDVEATDGLLADHIVVLQTGISYRVWDIIRKEIVVEPYPT